MSENQDNEQPKKREIFMMPGVRFLTGTGKYAPDKKYADFNRRMMAATIDSLLAMIILAPVMDFLLSNYAPLPEVDWAGLRAQIPPGATEGEANQFIARKLVADGYAHAWLKNFFYQCLSMATAVAICWHFWSSTPGKMLMRMKIVDADSGEPISNRQIWLRLLGYVVSTLPLCAGFFWMGISKRRQAWHDRMANTVVINLPMWWSKPATEAAAASGSPEPSAKE